VKPFARTAARTALWSLLTALSACLLFTAAYLALFPEKHPECSTRDIASLPSPSSRFTVLVRRMDCARPDSYAYILEFIGPEVSAPRQEATFLNPLTGNGEQGIDVRWSGDDTLVVSFAEATRYEVRSSAKGGPDSARDRMRILVRDEHAAAPVSRGR